MYLTVLSNSIQTTQRPLLWSFVCDQ